jgi:hypothetical protein
VREAVISPVAHGEIMTNLLTFQKKPNYLLRIIGWSGLAVGVVSVGLAVGWELRLRYKFNHRSPYDYYSHAGDQEPLDSYAVGI